jgi:hypothetical protein
MRVAPSQENVMLNTTMNVVEMNNVAAIATIANNCSRGMTTSWDVNFLESIGIELSDNVRFNIEYGLTTVEDEENLWDAAFFSGVI